LTATDQKDGRDSVKQPSLSVKMNFAAIWLSNQYLVYSIQRWANIWLRLHPHSDVTKIRRSSKVCSRLPRTMKIGKQPSFQLLWRHMGDATFWSGNWLTF